MTKEPHRQKVKKHRGPNLRKAQRRKTFFKGDDHLRSEIRDVLVAYHVEIDSPLGKKDLRKKREDSFRTIVDFINGLKF